MEKNEAINLIDHKIIERVALDEYYHGDQLPMSAWSDKYKDEGEISPTDMHIRMARQFARKVEENNALPFYGDSAALSDYGRDGDTLNLNKIFDLFKDFKHIIPQGSVMSMLGVDKIGSLSNCFVVGQPYDSYGGIFQKDQQLAQLMKRRGGVGIDISTLRPSGIKVTNAAGTSAGAVSFMDRLSNTTREVAQNGRRGALMITIDVRHPDVLEFINVKQDKSRVTGANISVMLRDDFMEAVKKDEDYILRFPCNENIMFHDAELDGAPYNELITLDGDRHFRKVKAKEIYDAVVFNAHDNAEPGQMFVDRHWNYSPDGIYPQYRGVTTNPCGEIFMQQYDACRLVAMNLVSVVDNPFTPNAKINYDRVYTTSYQQQILADSLVDLELEHIDRILRKIESDPEPQEVKEPEIALWTNIREVAASGRRTGSGFTGLGDMLAAVGLKYDSVRSKEVIDKVLKTKMKAELNATIDLAIKHSPFKGWDPTIEYTDVSKNGLDIVGNNEFYEMIRLEFPEEFQRMMKHGRRNVSWSTVAPTGTLSLIAKVIKYPNLSAGMEPQFMVYYLRNKKINSEDKTTVPDFVDQNGDAWKQYPVMMGAFKDWIEINYKVDPSTISKEEVEKYFEESPWYKACAPDINWKTRVEIQGIIQKYTSHSISSTINLPEDVSVEEVSDIYMHAYDYKLKGVTVYRDGSRTGVLVNDEHKEDSFEYHDAPKRPKCLPVEINTTVSKGTPWNVLVGLYDGKPYEVFAVPFFTKENDFELCKAKRGQYDLMKGEEVFRENITDVLTDEESALTRMISTSLRHGADITYIVEQLNKSHGDITSFSKAIARTLKKYVNEDKMLSRASCSECKSTNIRYEEGCMKCIDCGDSKCG